MENWPNPDFCPHLSGFPYISSPHSKYSSLNSIKNLVNRTKVGLDCEIELVRFQQGSLSIAGVLIFSKKRRNSSTEISFWQILRTFFEFERDLNSSTLEASSSLCCLNWYFVSFFKWGRTFNLTQSIFLWNWLSLRNFLIVVRRPPCCFLRMRRDWYQSVQGSRCIRVHQGEVGGGEVLFIHSVAELKGEPPERIGSVSRHECFRLVTESTTSGTPFASWKSLKIFRKGERSGSLLPRRS